MSSATISMVKDAFTKEVKDFPAGRVLAAIRGEQWRECIGQVRQAPDKESASKLKTALPGILWSGRFSERKNSALVEHSGLLCADLDNLNGQFQDAREKLLASPHLWALFTSPSGGGLKAIFRTRADGMSHKASYRAVEQHVRELAGIQIDESCKDVARLCFVSHDPDAYHNPQAAEIEPLPEPEKPKATPHAMMDLSERQRIAAELLGAIEWETEASGLATCPGKHLHTTGDKLRDCLLYLDGVPSVHCVHNSCRGIVHGVNHELRSRISKAEFAGARNRVSLAETGGHRHPDDPGASASPPPVKPSPAPPALQGSAVICEDVEPWPEAVNGAEVLDDIASAIKRYVSLPTGAADATALWCAHTHCFQEFQCSPRLNICSPDKGCGKTTLRDVIKEFVRRPFSCENATTATLFRLVSKFEPTLLLDESDTWLRDSEELRGILNSGHGRGGCVPRCEGDSHEIRVFPTFAPAVLCGIGALPGTLHDRSIVVRLTRAKLGEVQARFDSRHIQREKELCRKLTRFCADNRERLATIDPKMPSCALNRRGDNWRPLFAIAEVAGGDWPKRCVGALSKLTDSDLEAESLRVMLLADIQPIVEKAIGNGNEWLASSDMIDGLLANPERPWKEVNRGKEINERWLARRLDPIKPGRFRDDARQQARGYRVPELKDAIERFVSPPALSGQASHTRENGNSQVSQQASQNLPDKRHNSVEAGFRRRQEDAKFEEASAELN